MQDDYTGNRKTFQSGGVKMIRQKNITYTSKY